MILRQNYPLDDGGTSRIWGRGCSSMRALKSNTWPLIYSKDRSLPVVPRWAHCQASHSFLLNWTGKFIATFLTVVGQTSWFKVIRELCHLSRILYFVRAEGGARAPKAHPPGYATGLGGHHVFRSWVVLVCDTVSVQISATGNTKELDATVEKARLLMAIHSIEQ